MNKPDPAVHPFRLRPAAFGGSTASSSMLRVARTTAVAARSTPVLQASRGPRQLAFDFHAGDR